MGSFDDVMLVCTGNICRSPMAAAVLGDALRRAGAGTRIASAGLQAATGAEADPLAVLLMDERGLDIRDHRASQFTGARGLQSDLILVMDAAQRHTIETQWPLLQGRVYGFGHWGRFDVDDPYQRGEQAFRKALDAIDKGLTRWLDVITD